VNRRFALPDVPVDWVTQVVDLPADCIQRLCVLFEAYDNLCLVRTPVRGQGRVYVFCWKESLPLVRRILADIGREFPVRLGPVEDRILDDYWSDV